MEFKRLITDRSIKHYKLVTIIMVLFTLGLAAFLPLIKVDTDPENMLSKDEPVRIFHEQTKKDFALSDIVVVGIINEENPNGVFNASSLAKINDLTEFAKTLVWPDKNDPNKQVGVLEIDLLAPSTVDYIGQGEPGVVKFEWLMRNPPKTDSEALEIRDKALSNPLLKDTLVSADGKAICLYLPLTSKDLSYKVYSELKKRIAQFDGPEEFHITGLPVAEDTFGVEMFKQMAISAPLAMLTIFILMLLFFRKLVLVISPMIIAMVSVLSTMGLLIAFGFPVHIMSSMIPIFLMPIAVVDSVHILSEFFDRYTKEKGKIETIREVMDNLFTPMLYTSLTSAAGFISLSLTPIPPVQIFGIFVAIGIMVAWVFTVTFVPAYIMIISDKRLENFGHQAVHEEKKTWLSRLLEKCGKFTYTKAKPILVVMLIIVVIAFYGVTRIQINDNPVKWFSKSHPIRQADIKLNEHFGGTYMAYLVLEDASSGNLSHEYTSDLRERTTKKLTDLRAKSPDYLEIANQTESALLDMASDKKTKQQLLDSLILFADDKLKSASDSEFDGWYEVSDFFQMEKERVKIFKNPQALNYISKLQEHLAKSGKVGKSNSVADVVKKVNQELIDGKEANYRIPDTLEAVAQSLLQFQSSHNPDDLWHLVTYDYDKANIWLQLTSGDNKDMEAVVKEVDKFFEENEPPVEIKYNWAGLTYINTVWQEKMVWGMLQSFLGSFIIVFIMMSILFRSALWGIICMIPLTITIVCIYGIIGLAGKDYDMPVAVLSALTLGMAVDFAIHFLERARAAQRKKGSWGNSVAEMFGEPAQAISRNVLVIAIGFLPLLAAPLVPYKTVGIFLCSIMGLSGAITLIILPSLLKLMEHSLFRPIVKQKSMGCRCGFCLLISIAVVLLIAVNLHQYWHIGWGKMAWMSIFFIPVLAILCGMMSRRRNCKTNSNNNKYEKVG